MVVVGASGILAPLASLLATSGRTRVGVARGRQPVRGEWDRFVTLDARSADEVQRLRDDLAEHCSPWIVVGYQPALTPDSWRALTTTALGAVLLLPSRFADPESGPRRTAEWEEATGSDQAVLVQLGWTDPHPGVGSRWHTAQEISRLVAETLLGMPFTVPASRHLTLGSVRPWPPPLR